LDFNERQDCAPTNDSLTAVPGRGNHFCPGPTNVFIPFTEEEVHQSISNRFESQVSQHPDRLALKTKTHQFTYEALNRMANRIAWSILSKSDQEAEPVGILLDHGALSIVAMLGIVKAGKICVAIDPSLPKTRMDSILNDSQAKILVTNHNNLLIVSELQNKDHSWINIDEIDSHLSPANPRLAISPDTFVNIKYTSGSTGRPKGIILTHRQALHNIFRHTNADHLCSDDRISMLAPLATNGIEGSLCALLNGATLYPFNIREEGLAHLADWLIAEGITVYSSVATVFRQFLSTLTITPDFRRLRLIRIGGEQVRKSDVELFQKCFSNDCILEVTLSAAEGGNFCHYYIGKTMKLTDDIVPVGFAVPGVEILLLDDDGAEVECGNVGEIAIKSRYLATGYWKNPELTKSVFLPDPDGTNMRIYHTGDLGMFHPDRCLVHKGRKDFRVKIRGHNVELVEIENMLLKHPSVAEAVAVAADRGLPEKSLVGYVVPKENANITADVLRHFLKEHLPDYMIPSAFMILKVFPLTNGKIDRKALPNPDDQRPELGTPYVPPRNDIDEQLTSIWEDVLNIRPIGIYDNFFDLGGHSLTAMRVVSRVIKQFQLEIPLQSLFQSPTVADMAAVITGYQGKVLDAQGLATMLDELESLSEEDAEQLLGTQHHDISKS